MPTCRQVARGIASDELAAASWRGRAALRIHLLFCKHCRRYGRQMRAIGRAAQAVFEIREEDADALDRLEHTIIGSMTEATRSDVEETRARTVAAGRVGP